MRHFTDSLLLAREEAELEDSATSESLTNVHLIQTLSDIFFGNVALRMSCALWFVNRGFNSLPHNPRKKPFENIVGKGENAVKQHFLLFPTMFSTPVKERNPRLSYIY